MKKVINRFFVFGLAAFAVGSANAITFSNVVVTGPSALIGTLGVDHFINVGVDDIDFLFNKAIVGDAQPLRVGAINITFEAKDVSNITLDKLTLSFTNLLFGSGHIHFDEIVEDMSPNNFGVIATYSTDLYPGAGPVAADIYFSKPSKHVKVKKSIFLDALEVPQQLDLAGVGLVEQRLVPEPASMIALSAGFAALAIMRRRR